MPGVRDWASPIESTRSRPFAADTGSTTRTSRSIRAERQRRDSGRLRSPRTRPTASSPHSPGPGFPGDRVQFPPLIDPTINIGGIPGRRHPAGLTLPRFQNWSMTYQRQLTGNMMLTISYIGNRGSRLNHHWQTHGRRREHEPSRCVGAWHTGAAGQHQLAIWPGTPATRRLIPDSPGMWRRRCGYFHSIKPSNGAVSRLDGANTTRWKRCSSGASRVVFRPASHIRFRSSRTMAPRLGLATTAATAVSRIPRIRCHGWSATTTRRTWC